MILEDIVFFITLITAIISYMNDLRALHSMY